MKTLSYIVPALMFLMTHVASTQAKQNGTPPDGFVRIAPGGTGFTLDGKPWHPMGCNYFDPHVGWAPQLWKKFDAQRVEEHFRVMESLGVNLVRVFLTAQSFFAEPPQLDPDGILDCMFVCPWPHWLFCCRQRWRPTIPRRTRWLDNDSCRTMWIGSIRSTRRASMMRRC